jgi:hypothetical protein
MLPSIAKGNRFPSAAPFDSLGEAESSTALARRPRVTGWLRPSELPAGRRLWLFG